MLVVIAIPDMLSTGAVTGSGVHLQGASNFEVSCREISHT